MVLIQRAIYFSENMARKSINFDRNANEFFLGINRIITNCFRRESIVTKLYDDVIFYKINIKMHLKFTITLVGWCRTCKNVLK